MWLPSGRPCWGGGRFCSGVQSLSPLPSCHGGTWPSEVCVAGLHSCLQRAVQYLSPQDYWKEPLGSTLLLFLVVGLLARLI